MTVGKYLRLPRAKPAARLHEPWSSLIPENENGVSARHGQTPPRRGQTGDIQNGHRAGENGQAEPGNVCFSHIADYCTGCDKRRNKNSDLDPRERHIAKLGKQEGAICHDIFIEEIRGFVALAGYPRERQVVGDD